ncbi:MAG: OB-fold nucleic acid binding domain-containing protein [Candidatus Bathyarchaeia archaeon]|jgi:replication factor A1
MTTQEIIDKILAKNPDVSQKQILEKVQAEKARTGGLLDDKTLLRLIAAKYGVEVQQNTIHNNGTLSSGRLFAGLNNVTVAGRLIAVFPARTFEGEKPGKFANLMITDNDGILRVVLWNDKADLVEKGELKVGQAVRLLHGYTRQDLYGKVELHLGVKSQIEVEPQEKACEYPAIDRFTTKIGSLNKTSGCVHLSGTVKAVLGLTKFTRNDQSDGTVMRFTLADDSGEVTVVAWNEKAQELEKNLKANACLQLGNAKVKETQNDAIEVHVDFTSFVNVQAAAPQLTKIGSLTENQITNVEGTVSTVPETKEVNTSKGETVKLTVFELKDESGAVRISAWRQHAEDLNGLKIGDKLFLENAYVKKGFGNKIELSTRSATAVSIMPP